MYHILPIFFVFLFLSACKNNKATENSNSSSKEILAEPASSEFTEMKFEHIAHKFGKVTEGTMIKHTFKFTNTGTTPLIISEVAPQCGCTTTDFPKKPILPNQTGEITLELDTKGKRGEIEKNARIVANIEGGTMFLFLRGEVIATDSARPASLPR
jgi:hypothetical protein